LGSTKKTEYARSDVWTMRARRNNEKCNFNKGQTFGQNNSYTYKAEPNIYIPKPRTNV